MRSLVVAASVLLAAVSAKADEDLFIEPVIQQTDVWCWAAVSEMVLEHFGVDNANPNDNFQCAIVAAAGVLSGAPQCFANCGFCVVSAGNASNLRYWLENYSEVASQFLGYSLDDVRTRYRPRRLRWGETTAEIDAGNPIIVGVSPGQNISMQGTSQHVALIVAYEDQDRQLVVNDPYPYPLKGWNDPYLAAGGEMIELGQYRIGHSALVSGLNWRESILVEQQ